MFITSTSPENAADITILKAKLADLPIGSTLPYADLDAALGRPVRARRWLLDRALADLEADMGCLFATVRDVGIKRLAGADIPDVGLDGIRRIRRTAKRAHDRLSGVRVNDLPEPERVRLIAHQSMLGAISMIADGRKAAALSAEISTTGHVVAAGRVLDIFKATPAPAE